MLKKLLPAVVAVYVLWLTSVHMNDKLMRGYFMAPLKFKELVAEDNMSEREEDFGFKSKIWLYGTNSPEKLSEYFNAYEGFEVDVVYDEKEHRFMVGRGEEKTTLDDMFAAQPDLSGKFFWLDIKNVDFNNKTEILKELIALAGRNIIHKSHLVVVSPNSEYLDEFAASGFLTGFEFPSLLRVKRDGIRKVLETAVEKYRNSTVDFVCGDVRYFNFMDFYFPDAPKMYQNTGREAKNINPYILKRPDTFVVLNQEPDVKKIR